MDINHVSQIYLNSENKRVQFSGLKAKNQNIVPSDKFKSQEVENLDLRTKILNLKNNKDKEIKPIKTRQYSDYKGRVTNMALMLKGLRDEKKWNQLKSTYKTLFEKMEPDTRFTICYNLDHDKQDIENLIKDSNISNPERIKFIKPEVGNLNSIWARDMTVSTFSQEDPNKSLILKSKHIHSGDGNIPQFIVQEEKNPSLGLIEAQKLVIDGGDTLSNPKESFVGFESIKETAERLKNIEYSNPDFNKWAVGYYKNVMNEGSEKVIEIPQTGNQFLGKDKKDYKSLTYKSKYEEKMYEDLAVKLFEEYMGKPVTPLGKDDILTPEVEKSAAFHQDMCLTPVDDKTFFLGDPNLFEEIVSSMSPQELEVAKEQFAKVCEEEIGFEDYIEKFRTDNNSNDFEAYNKILKEKNYNVKRLPFMFSSSNKFPTFSYNNCLMENFEKEGKLIKRVFLPVIGVDKFDDYAINLYKEEGFEVYPVPMGEISKLKGELRCMTNWLERSEKV